MIDRRDPQLRPCLRVFLDCDVAGAERRRERAVCRPDPDENRPRRRRRRALARRRAAAPGAAAGTSRSAGRRRVGRARSRPARRPRARGGRRRRRGRPSRRRASNRRRDAARVRSPCSSATSQPGCANAAAATKTPVRPRPDDGARTKGTCSTSANPSSVDGGSSSRSARIWEVGASTPGSRRASSRSCSGLGKRAEALEQPLDEVDLRLRERRVEPDAASRDPMPARRLDHVVPRRASEVRVVEDDPPAA